MMKIFARRSPAARHAFTLMEVLIALALTGILMTALSMVSFNVLSVWVRQAEDPLFDRHTDGLRRALEECLAETTEAADSVGTVRTASAVFSVAPGSVGVERAPYLRITGAPPFLISDTQPLGFVHGWLRVEDDAGLVLYWQTDDERRENADATHRLVLSPWVDTMQLFSYDTTNDIWDEADGESPSTVPSGAAVFMQLNLNHRGQTRQIMLPLSENVPHNLNY
ncbi:MAG: prepilin-type N-terminal cleavage/methylation domain-containing protein [Puniceicoccales bacterium]|jgi:prepilin-type N-terminal cleavage/methylation domain-containing protein|nr:prepilin-type N-terminal cleavage/methylation domain-containing protein [Puniceicoccales bacterium]